MLILHPISFPTKLTTTKFIILMNFSFNVLQDGIRALQEDKSITGELGNVTPFIIVPGEWTDVDLKYQAKSIVSGLLQNSGHNCCALEVWSFSGCHGSIANRLC